MVVTDARFQEAKPTALQGLAAALNSVSALALIGLGLAVSM